MVRADEFPLEDVVTHVLTNADRYRVPGTPIRMGLSTTEASAHISIANQGPSIAPALLERVFEYGVSDPAQAAPAASGEHRGQGLFVVKTYLAKMGGTVAVRNLPDGVDFRLSLQRTA